MAFAALGALQGVGCTPWRPLVSAALPVAFAWQAWHLMLCKGSDVRPGVPLSHGGFCAAETQGTWCSARAYGCTTPCSPLSAAACHAFATGRAAETKVLCKGVRIRTPWQSQLGLRCSAGGFCVAGSGDQGDFARAYGSVRPGRAPWSPLLFRWLLPPAGVALRALQGRTDPYALE